MSRYRPPEYFRDYKVTCRGFGRTVAEAEYNLLKDISYQKKWIRGAVIKEERWGDNNQTAGTDIYRYCDLYFKQRRYLKDKSREIL